MSARGQIHDIGYAPYRGPRLPTGRRFWIIAKNVLAVAYKTRWALKGMIALSLVTVAIGCVTLYLAHLGNQLASGLGQGHGHAGAGAPLLKVDATLGEMVSAFVWQSFILALMFGCAAVANDLRLGAFQFYFSRPIFPRHYVAGKLLGVSLLAAIPLLFGMVLLALFRLLLAPSFSDALGLFPVVLKAIAVGVLGTAAIAFPATASGALLKNRWGAFALFTVFVLVTRGVASLLAVTFDFPYLGLLSPIDNVQNIGHALFGAFAFLPQRGMFAAPPAWMSIVAVLVTSALCALLIGWRVKSVEAAGLGTA